ncbi:efflux RND transporter periplasmic adaptor subunit [Pseudoxanthomonas sacheonensis]|uniref:Cobalt-zinc-cadmium efflux system membrane fusion protein n=1 Tax=Pseudoxanthomonas sacheonensis TaxID=443615 RepID=A0ABU1RTC1_9GAMM|nr:efflux RND transporter periplasmic adaptor subunit [Pseudoxanthomonas sacheonensis]MDR6842012.1 cobalt-zinc-cadmium efflux system membrane fusion protein [Pseudoxanthomonas sacheonensis]
MKVKKLIGALTLALLLGACGKNATEEHGHEEGGEHAEAEEAKKGAHGGRLLEQGGYAVELAIAEDGTPPKYQAWLYEGGEPVPATAGTVEVRLKRLGGIAENHMLKPQADGSLMAASIVGEPHSFDVEVLAKIEGKTLHWEYPSYEGRTEIAAKTAADSGIRVAPAGPGVIADEHEVQGLLTPMEGRIANVMARFPGPIRNLRANVGDSVRAGQPLASVESNLSLTTYTVSAPISGVVLARNASVGSVASEGSPLFEIADLSSLWVDLHIFGSDAQHIRPGVPVKVTRMSDGATIETVLERVLPGTATASQSTVARATIANVDGLWRPGSAVKARITVERQPAAMVVPLSALQNFRDWDAVFIRVGDLYEVRPVELGKRDATHVEVLSGLKAGDAVVTEQSYLIKADIEKSGASHDH